MTLPAPRLLLAVALGGAAGAVARFLLGLAVPDGSGLAWTTFSINVAGALALAALPAVGVVRRSATLGAGLGAGALGGFTTLSATSEQARGLLAEGRAALAAAYLLATLGAALVAVAIGARWAGAARQRAAGEEGDL